MSTRRFSCPVVGLAFLLTACGRMPGQDQPAGAIIEGVVKDAAGEPLGGISVRALVWTEEEARSESTPAGRFRLELSDDAARGAALLARSAGGKLLGFHQMPWNGSTGVTEPVEIVMTAPRTIGVMVKDGNGHAVAGADVEISVSHRPVAQGMTDANGSWRAHIPASAPLHYVIALKDGVGFDYFQNPRQYESAPNTEVPHEFELTLDGAIDLEVLAATDDGEPVPGIEFQPWTIQKPGRPDDVNLSGSRIVRSTANEQGIATFGWLPPSFVRAITILMRSEEWHAPDWPSLQAAAIESRLTYRLRRMVPVSGRVFDADGNPIAGMRVSIAGQGGNMRDDFRGIVVTDADGRYEAIVPPQVSYILTVEDDQWTSEHLMNIPVYSGRPRDDLDLTLIPGTLVRGSVRQPDGTPLSGQTVSFRLDGDQTQFPADDDSNYWRAPTLYRRAVTNDEGRYELRLAPGIWKAWGPDGRFVEDLVVADQAGLEFDFEFEVRMRQPLTGLVVRADDGNVAVPDVAVSGVQIDPEGYADISAITGDDGRFSTERFPSRMLLHALSSDGALGATQEIQKDDGDVVIAVAPTSSAVGRVVDEQGRPTAGFRFRYAIEVKYPNDTMTSRFGGIAFTDDEGRFRLETLIVNQEYECRHELNGTYYLVTNVTATDTAEVDLGTLTYPRGQRDRTYVEWVRDAFARAGDLAAAVESAVEVAALVGRRILLVEGSRDDEFVRSIFRVFDDDSRTWDPGQDPLTQHLAHFVLVGVTPDDAQTDGRLVVLDHERSVVAEAGTDDLIGETGEADATLLTQFLSGHAPAPVNAEEQLAEAMEASAESGKPILVIQVMPHDDQSKRMLEFIIQMRPLLERHFTLCPVEERMARGRELTRALRESLVERYVDRSRRQIPWTAVIDASGTRLSAAEINDYTVGYPSTPEQIDVFLGALREGAPEIPDVEMKQLREALVPPG